MRSLIRLVQVPVQRSDRGATLVWVGLMMTVLLGVGAVVIDAGALYNERRQLQNGADAAALAIARDCAGGNCQNFPATANTYADQNANDNLSNIDVLCGSGLGLPPCTNPPPETNGKTSWVMVTTSTQTADGSNKVDFVLAPLLPGGDASRGIEATAIASWGEGIGQGNVIPVVMSVCEFKALGGSIDGSQFATGTGYVYLHGDGPDHGCLTSPSGLQVPGGFGWIDNATNCQTVPVTVGDWVDSEIGNSNPCSSLQFEQWRDATLLVPLYDDTRLSGSNAQYHIIGFAVFKVLGYDLKSGGTWGAISSCPDTSGNSSKCLYGEFSDFAPTIGDPGDVGGGTNFGVSAITMIG